MIQYHGSPLSGDAEQQINFYRGRHVLVSYATYRDMHTVITDVCSSFCLDNGAYSFWKSGTEISWKDFYLWLDKWVSHPKFDFFFIPDVIGQDKENENNQLVAGCPVKFDKKHFACPVYHLGESLKRIDFFHELGYRRFAVGSTPGFELKSLMFWNDMRKVFDHICENGVPKFKVHGLRMLDPEIVEAFPFSSGDSTNATLESTFDYKWLKYPYAPESKSGRAALVADKMARSQSPSFYKNKPVQMELI